MAVYDALEIRLIDEDRPAYVRIPEGRNVEEELEAFLKQSEAHDRSWVLVEDGRYVRYNRVVSVSIARGRDDERPPMTSIG